TPIQVGTATDWVMVSAGDVHTMGIREAANGDRTLWAWGLRTNGRLGDGGDASSVDWRTAPMQVGTATDWLMVSAGTQHTMGIREAANGYRTLWAWGSSSSGRLGNGWTGGAQGTPIQIGTSTDWVMVSAGLWHTMGIREAANGDRTLWAWGDRSLGQLGEGAPDGNQTTPIQVGVATDWATVSAGAHHTMGIREAANGTGTLWAWGRRNFGRLGDGFAGTAGTYLQPTPVQVN
ncbi:MAG: chromosome condensation regulator, partial [Treponema sp.]|nr:chromosome condensation regulator [Treponema sp.]